DRDEPESEGSIFAPEDIEPETPAPMEEPASLAAEEPVWSTPDVTEVEPVVPAAAAAPAPAPVAEAPAAAAATSTGTGDLTDEQIDRIARRVVQLMSDQVVRNIAWEVIPDLAEMVVKERIRQLESE
ncbi:MAG: hypothetical protein JOZ54_04640, partial [Acidobacteria bacterium]|nr:hypothetical protein [Acidobacteriota bacterium]